LNPPIEEVSGVCAGTIGSLKARTIWTYRNIIGKELQDRVDGVGIVFAQNGETITYTVDGNGTLLSNFGYRIRGTMKFRVHSGRSK